MASTPNAPSATGNAPPGTGSTTNTGSLPVVLKVTFNLVTPDGQRKIGFTLEKDSNGMAVTWTISFALYEKAAGATTFGDPTISLNVTVSPTLHANAQTASQNGLTDSQIAHATGPAADAAKALAAGTGSHMTASNSIQNTLK